MSPTTRAALALGACALSALVVPPALALITGLAVAAVVAVDAVFARRPPVVRRQVPSVLSRGVPSPLVVEVEAPSASRVLLRQARTPDLDVDPVEAVERLEGEVLPRRRGRHRLPPPTARLVGPLGLGRCDHSRGEAADLLVYPDLPAARRLAIAVRTGRFREPGRISRGALGLGGIGETHRRRWASRSKGHPRDGTPHVDGSYPTPTCLASWLVSDPLKSARLKLDRAREHVIGQQTATRRAIQDEARPFDFRIEDDPEMDNRVVITVSHVAEYPPFLATLIGDAIYNFQCVLDHIAWRLVQNGRTPELPPGKATQVQFPIYKTLEEFDDNLARRLPGIADLEETVIRSHQPYKRGALAESHPLWTLQRLSNTDKHRNLQPVKLASAQFRMTTPVVPPGCQVLSIEAAPGVHQPLQVDAQLAYIYVRDRAPCHGGMHVQAEGAVLPSLGEGLWLDETIRQIDREVESILIDIARVL